MAQESVPSCGGGEEGGEDEGMAGCSEVVYCSTGWAKRVVLHYLQASLSSIMTHNGT